MTKMVISRFFFLQFNKVGHLATDLSDKRDWGIDNSAGFFPRADKYLALPVITIQINGKLCIVLIDSSCS